MAEKTRGPILAPEAEDDLREILHWTLKRFGVGAVSRYAALIKQAVRDVGSGPNRLGAKLLPRMFIASARTYHIKFSRNRVEGEKVQDPRHMLVCRVREDGIVEVARILHDSRDLARHIPDSYQQKDG